MSIIENIFNLKKLVVIFQNNPFFDGKIYNNNRKNEG